MLYKMHVHKIKDKVDTSRYLKNTSQIEIFCNNYNKAKCLLSFASFFIEVASR